MLGFTLCSNNYIAHAKTLAESWRVHHPECRFVVGLVDRKHPDINYELPGDCELLPVEQLRIVDFERLVLKYDIVELNTAVKPFYFEYFLREERSVIYLDPDIYLFSPLHIAKNVLDDWHIALTPHICSPVDGSGPNDMHLLRGGIFNLGFLGLSRSDPTQEFLQWWKARMKRYAYHNQIQGLFYDQVWLNYAPVFLSRCHIIRDLGYNVANWNLHERTITESNDGFFINRTTRLVFFHFSHYDPRTPTIIAHYNHRYTFVNRPDLTSVFANYRRQLMKNGHDIVRNIPFGFSVSFNIRVRRMIVRMIENGMLALGEKLSPLRHGPVVSQPDSRSTADG